MNVETLINLNEPAYINSLTSTQITYLIAEAKNALTLIDQHTITFLKLLALIRSLELRLAELEYQPHTISPKPRPTW